MPTTWKYTVGPDHTSGLGPGINWSVENDEGAGDSGGWACPESSYPDDPRVWVKRLRRHVNLPAPVRKAGQRWADATVKPYGWSEGAGHAPQGVEITWTLK